MIKIRYAELPTGLHIQALAQGHDTVLYLLPGLTAAERRSAIRRARSSARVGHGPPLPAAGMAIALMLDGVRTTLGNGMSAMRMHPSFFVPAVVVIASVAAAYLLLASVTIQFRHPEASGTRPGVIGAEPGLSPAASPGAVRHPASAPGPSGGPQPSSGAGGSGGNTPSPHPTPTVSASPSPSITPEPTSPPPPSGPTPTPSPPSGGSPSPTPAPSPSPTRLCLIFGPLGVCLRG